MSRVQLVRSASLLILLFATATASAATTTLTGTVRDFRRGDLAGGHPDFETKNLFDPGIVQSVLGADGKPVYAGLAGNDSTSGATNFNDWFHDTSANLSTTYSITLDDTGSPGVFRFVSDAFFPIDGQLFGNEFSEHPTRNFNFTFELHTTFTKAAGQSFSFLGDDDLWVFINGQLVIDLGGVHSAMGASVNLDTLGLTNGTIYSLDLFFAERHTSASNFKVETSLVLETPTTRDNALPLPSSCLIWSLLTLGAAAGKRRWALGRA